MRLNKTNESALSFQDKDRLSVGKPVRFSDYNIHITLYKFYLRRGKYENALKSLIYTFQQEKVFYETKYEKACIKMGVASFHDNDKHAACFADIFSIINRSSLVSTEKQLEHINSILEFNISQFWKMNFMNTKCNLLAKLARYEELLKCAEDMIKEKTVIDYNNKEDSDLIEAALLHKSVALEKLNVYGAKKCLDKLKCIIKNNSSNKDTYILLDFVVLYNILLKQQDSELKLNIANEILQKFELVSKISLKFKYLFMKVHVLMTIGNVDEALNLIDFDKIKLKGFNIQDNIEPLCGAVHILNTYIAKHGYSLSQKAKCSAAALECIDQILLFPDQNMSGLGIYNGTHEFAINMHIICVSEIVKEFIKANKIQSSQECLEVIFDIQIMLHLCAEKLQTYSALVFSENELLFAKAMYYMEQYKFDNADSINSMQGENTQTLQFDSDRSDLVLLSKFMGDDENS